MDRGLVPGSVQASARQVTHGQRVREDRSRPAFSRALDLPGWEGGSTWGYDAELECYWVELRRGDSTRSIGAVRQGDASLRIGPEHLITTVPGLARAMAFAVEVADVEAYLALTA